MLYSQKNIYLMNEENWQEKYLFIWNVALDICFSDTVDHKKPKLFLKVKMDKLRLSYFCCIMRRHKSLEKTIMLGNLVIRAAQLEKQLWSTFDAFVSLVGDRGELHMCIIWISQAGVGVGLPLHKGCPAFTPVGLRRGLALQWQEFWGQEILGSRWVKIGNLKILGKWISGSAFGLQGLWLWSQTACREPLDYLVLPSHGAWSGRYHGTTYGQASPWPALLQYDSTLVRQRGVYGWLLAWLPSCCCLCILVVKR